MDSTFPKTEKSCPREEISFYLDGELSANDEILLEKHLAECPTCLSELNLQKKLLSALDFAFEKRGEIELPENFTKVVVTKAESEVVGLRSKKERSLALFLFLGLFLLLTVGFAAESEKILAWLNELGNQVLAVGAFIVHFSYNISFGLAVIFKSLSQKIIFSETFLLLIFAGLLFLFLLTIPKFLNKSNRVKTS